VSLGKIIRMFGAYIVVPILSKILLMNKCQVAIIRSERLGHLAKNTHLFFIRKKMGILENVNYLLIAPSKKSKKVANASLLTMFIEYSKNVKNVHIFCSSIIYSFINFFLNEFRGFNVIYNLPMESREDEFSLGINTIEFSEQQKKYGESVLKKMPLTNNKKIVTIFSRDPNYLNNKYPGHDWSYHSYRNADIETFIDSIKYLITMNYSVIRLGSKHSKKLNFIDDNYLDYSQSEFKCDFMDLYLIKKSFFVVGTTSGAIDVSGVFNVPLVGVNFAPFVESPTGRDDIFIQKKIMNMNDQIVPYKDIISKSKYHLFDGVKFKQLHGLKYVDNSAKDVLDAVKDMNNFLSGNIILNKKQKKLLDRYHNEYCQRNNWSRRMAPISINWLEKNHHLYLED